MRIVFMGTPDFAVPSLEICHRNHQVVGVISQPDRPRGRGKAVTFSPLKQRAVELGLDVFTFEKIGVEGVSLLRSLAPDIMVTAAYGQILTDEILSIAKHGIINVHGSILPSWRGSSPVQHSILSGDKESGVTIMQTARAVDSGDIIRISKTPIGENEGTTSLLDRLARIGADTLESVLSDIEKGVATFTPQEHEKATFCKMLTKSDAVIDWSESAEQIVRKIRAFDYMGASTTLNGEMLKIYSATVVDEEGKTGEIISASDKTGVVVGCGDKSILIGQMLMAGGKRINSADSVRGRKIKLGDI
ncbi:MAG: methionyl-tRNA formyltransferase, partial [Clostridia bacterium]|nr:methionyl-tRNA formyltransferase [Clostridia bacterium]